ncbi:hypothetical protein, partial [Silvimonas sp.]|uniref:hypothetical protein n=1 Tax=Silvimonas sp. TaxID=2650811 RepID=UPI002849FEDC
EANGGNVVGSGGDTARRAHGPAKKLLIFKGKMARPKRFELLTLRFVVCSTKELFRPAAPGKVRGKLMT